MTIAYSGDSITYPDNSVQNTAPKVGMVNRIINGAMVIDQRNAGASVTPITNQYTVDRWNCLLSQASKFSVQQNHNSVTPPTGFTNYLGAVSLAATTLGSNDRFVIQQAIEGYNIADLGWGTASAKSITMSFWVRSSLTGTFGGALVGATGPASYPFAYTISAANTWEYVSITVPGPAFDTWGATTANGVAVRFSLGCGSAISGTAGAWVTANISSATGATSVVGTSGATFYITGVQLEKGSTATSFDYRPYTTELQLAQRYYQLAGMGLTYYNSTSGQQARFTGTPCVTPRTSPTFTLVSSNVVGNVSSATPSSYNSGAAIHLQLVSSGGSGVYTDANYTYSLSAEL